MTEGNPPDARTGSTASTIELQDGTLRPYPLSQQQPADDIAYRQMLADQQRVQHQPQQHTQLLTPEQLQYQRDLAALQETQRANAVAMMREQQARHEEVHPVSAGVPYQLPSKAPLTATADLQAPPLQKIIGTDPYFELIDYALANNYRAIALEELDRMDLLAVVGELLSIQMNREAKDFAQAQQRQAQQSFTG